MRLDPRSATVREVPRLARTLCVLLVASSLAIAGRPKYSVGDPGSAGGIPYAGNTLPLSSVTISFKVTIGQVVDSMRVPVAGVPVVVMLNGQPIVFGVLTNANGLFAVELPDVSGLSLTLPMNGIFDVPITAGNPVLVVLP